MDNRQNIIDDLNQLKNGMFATRDTITEGYKYSEMVIEALAGGEKIYVLTAVHVLLNSVADHFLRILEEDDG